MLLGSNQADPQVTPTAFRQCVVEGHSETIHQEVEKFYLGAYLALKRMEISPSEAEEILRRCCQKRGVTEEFFLSQLEPHERREFYTLLRRQ